MQVTISGKVTGFCKRLKNLNIDSPESIFSNFSGHQKLPALAASNWWIVIVVVKNKSHVQIIYNLFVIGHAKIILDGPKMLGYFNQN